MMDLDELSVRHAGLPGWYVEELIGCAALALQRHHGPGITLKLVIEGANKDEPITWRRRSGKKMMDAKRVTEDGAECVALTIVGIHRPEWRLVRRLQSELGEGADWLVRNVVSGKRAVLEISGTDEGPFEPRVRAKRDQAALAARRGATPAVSVVRFLEPKAMFEG